MVTHYTISIWIPKHLKSGFQMSDLVIRPTIWKPDIFDHKINIFVQFSDHHSKTEQYDNRTRLEHLNTRPVLYSDGQLYLRSMFEWTFNKKNDEMYHLCRSKRFRVSVHHLPVRHPRLPVHPWRLQGLQIFHANTVSHWGDRSTP